ncbi:hypothetical protein QNO08_17095 [Arthrobacter sp. zg-Y820]|nr:MULTISPECIES: hypothetical protein [unclassified Arthrobacter]MDK1280221.1 hypothetical protein [Arthrobacter sp. zg.Y820]MDK1360643.1 hypothetical protein [Arthrobacter sp. zg-Y1219]WIB09512.1 hypothetical protein QNO08_17095 [Arthrobacter sp. zg-Y820]
MTKQPKKQATTASVQTHADQLDAEGGTARLTPGCLSLGVG